MQDSYLAPLNFCDKLSLGEGIMESKSKYFRQFVCYWHWLMLILVSVYTPIFLSSFFNTFKIFGLISDSCRKRGHFCFLFGCYNKEISATPIQITSNINSLQISFFPFNDISLFNSKFSTLLYISPNDSYSFFIFLLS